MRGRGHIGVSALALALFGLGAGPAIAHPEHEERIDIVGPAGRAHLGVLLDDVTAKDVARLKLGEERGALVHQVRDDTPAAKAGLEPGDVVLRYQGEAVASAATLRRLVRETPPGRKVTLEVSRDGAPRKLTVTLEEGPGLPALADLELDAPELLPQHFGLHRDSRLLLPPTPAPRRLGIAYQEISGQLARYFKLAGDTGVLVTSVEENGPAARAGIKAGDVVLELDGHTLRDGSDLRDTVTRLDAGAEIRIAVWRDGKRLELQLTTDGERRRHEPSR